MAIYGRGFAPSTQYQFTPPRSVPGAVSLAGGASMALNAAGTMTQVTTVVAPVSLASHRFRYTVEPAPQDFESVQRHLQRMSDEIAQSVNPIRSIADGGTGLDEVTVGAVMIGKTPNSMEAIPPGGAGQVLTIVSGKPAWAAGGAGAGEANTATNVGIGGIGVVSGKVGVDLQFRSINSVNTKLTVALDAVNKKVDLTINEANMALGSMGGSLVIGQVPNSLITYAKIQNVSATDKLLGRSTAGAGVIEEIACPAAGRTLIAAVDAAAERTVLGLGALALKATIATGDIDALAVTYPKIQNVTATDKLLGRATAGAGVIEEIACTAAARGVLDDVDYTAMRQTIGISIFRANADQASFANVQTNITNMGVAVGVSENWVLTGLLSVTMTGTLGVKFYFTFPVGCTGEIHYGGNIAALTTWQTGYQAVLTVPATFFVTGAITGLIEIGVMIRNGANAGTAQLVGITGGAASTCVLKMGSRLIAQRVGS